VQWVRDLGEREGAAAQRETNRLISISESQNADAHRVHSSELLEYD
jgi:hypothetical protein